MGSGRVFIVDTDAETAVDIKNMAWQEPVIGGRNGDKAGTGSIDDQVADITCITQILQDKYGLGTPISIIAHSMGGLVAHLYITTSTREPDW